MYAHVIHCIIYISESQLTRKRSQPASIIQARRCLKGTVAWDGVFDHSNPSKEKVLLGHNFLGSNSCEIGSSLCRLAYKEKMAKHSWCILHVFFAQSLYAIKYFWLFWGLFHVKQTTVNPSYPPFQKCLVTLNGQLHKKLYGRLCTGVGIGNLKKFA
jgi:hypothetical protein